MYCSTMSKFKNLDFKKFSAAVPPSHLNLNTNLNPNSKPKLKHKFKLKPQTKHKPKLGFLEREK